MTFEEIMREYKEANKAVSEAIDAYCEATLNKDKTTREKEFLFEDAKLKQGFAQGIGYLVNKYF